LPNIFSIKEFNMGRVYTDWRTVPDDPNRVGDYDYNPMSKYVDPEEYDEYEDYDEGEDDAD